MTGDPSVDKRIASAMQSVVDGRLHHVLLAILWEKYKLECFLPPALDEKGKATGIVAGDVGAKGAVGEESPGQTSEAA